jgi:hypothetical protein
MRVVGVLSVLMAWCEAAQAAEVLDISQGTMEAGGSATLYVQAIDDALGFGVTLVPQFGYFFTDQLEFTLGLGLSISAIETFTATSLSLQPGIQAVLGEGSIRPFVGASVPFTSLSFEGESVSTLGVSVPVGVLVPVSDAVAFSIGTSPSVVAQISDGGGPAIITVPAGALGVRSFFR